MRHGLGAADQADHIAHQQGGENQRAVAADMAHDHFQDIFQHAQLLQHAAHAHRKTDDRHILQHAAHSAAVQNRLKNSVFNAGGIAAVGNLNHRLQGSALPENGNRARRHSGNAQRHNGLHLQKKQNDNEDGRDQGHKAQLKLSVQRLDVQVQIPGVVIPARLPDSQNGEQNQADQKGRQRGPEHGPHMVSQFRAGHRGRQVRGIGKRTDLIAEHGAADYCAGHHARMDSHGVSDRHHRHAGASHRTVGGSGHQTQHRAEQKRQRQQPGGIDQPQASHDNGCNRAALQPGADHHADGHQQAHRRDNHADGLIGSADDPSEFNPENFTEQIDDNPAHKQPDHGASGFQEDADGHREDDEHQQNHGLQLIQLFLLCHDRFPSFVFFSGSTRQSSKYPVIILHRSEKNKAACAALFKFSPLPPAGCSCSSGR